MSVSVKVVDFGVLPDGCVVQAVTLAHGPVEMCVLTYGGILQSARTPDRRGVIGEVTLGHDRIEGYLASRSYPGAIIGRTAGRIAGGRITVDDRMYQLSQNENGNTLHGGAAGFDRALWRLVSAQVEGDAAVLRLAHISPAGDQGYPGALTVEAIYRLDGAGFALGLAATCDAPTPVNLTWHPYWNLSGTLAPVADHCLTLDAPAFYPSGAEQVTQAATDVAGSGLDLRSPQHLAPLLAAQTPQALAAGGIDHVFVRGNGAVAARLTHPASGRELLLATGMPALVVYTGAGLAGSPPGHRGRVIGRHSGIAIEPQARPDALPVLRPGECFDWCMALTFGIDTGGEVR